METGMKESQEKMGMPIEGGSSQHPRSDVKAIVDEWRDCGEAGDISGEAQKARGEVGEIVDEWRDCGETESES
jgi:hypothetical protein